MSGWHVEQKAGERTARNLLAVIKYSVGRVRAQARVTVDSKMLTLGKSPEWLEWTGRTTCKQPAGLGKVVWEEDHEKRRAVRETQG